MKRIFAAFVTLVVAVPFCFADDSRAFAEQLSPWAGHVLFDQCTKKGGEPEMRTMTDGQQVEVTCKGAEEALRLSIFHNQQAGILDLKFLGDGPKILSAIEESLSANVPTGMIVTGSAKSRDGRIEVDLKQSNGNESLHMEAWMLPRNSSLPYREVHVRFQGSELSRLAANMNDCLYARQDSMPAKCGEQK